MSVPGLESFCRFLVSRRLKNGHLGNTRLLISRVGMSASVTAALSAVQFQLKYGSFALYSCERRGIETGCWHPGAWLVVFLLQHFWHGVD